MKKILLMLLVLSISAMAAIHAGLKSAIDNGDMKKASAIINNLGVQDIYCPDELSVANGKNLYGKRFSENPDLLYDHCGSGFVQAYAAIACSDKSTVELCKRLLDGKEVSEWFPLLKSIRKNKLDQAPEEYEEEVEVQSKRSKKECEAAMENEEDYFWTLQDANEFEGPNGYKRIYNALMKDCMNSGSKTKKKVKKTRIINPFIGYIKKFTNYVTRRAMGLVDYTKEDSEKLEFVKSLPVTEDVLELMMKASMNSYRDSSYVNDKYILASCRYFPNFDKLLEKKIGFQVFSCKDALNAYSEKKLPVCDAGVDNMVYTTKPIMDDAPSFSFMCVGGVWNFATKEMLEAKKTSDSEKNTKPETPAVENVENERTIVRISSNPAGATVFVNGTMAKKVTPLKFKLKPGKADILVSMDDYMDKDTSIYINAGTPMVEVHLDLSPEE